MLKTRIALLMRNLELIQRTAVEDQRPELRKLLLLPRQVAKPFNNLINQVTQLQRNLTNENYDGLDDGLIALQEDLDAVAEQIAQLQGPADELRDAIALGDVEQSRINNVAIAIQHSLRGAVEKEFGPGPGPARCHEAVGHLGRPTGRRSW